MVCDCSILNCVSECDVMPVFNGFTPVQRSSDACILSCLRENNNPFRSIHYIQRTHLKKFLSISLSRSLGMVKQRKSTVRPLNRSKVHFLASFLKVNRSIGRSSSVTQHQVFDIFNKLLFEQQNFGFYRFVANFEQHFMPSFILCCECVYMYVCGAHSELWIIHNLRCVLEFS